MKKLTLVLLFTLTALLSGCTNSITVVYAPKHIYIHGNHNKPTAGSDLKGNNANQEAKTTMKSLVDSFFKP